MGKRENVSTLPLGGEVGKREYLYPTFRGGGGAGSPWAGTATPGAGHLLTEADGASQAGHDAAKLEFHVLLRALQTGQGRLQGVDPTFSTAQLEAKVTNVTVGSLQGNLQVLALVLQLALGASRVVQSQLVVLLLHSGVVNQLRHLALQVGQLLAQCLAGRLRLHHLTPT